MNCKFFGILPEALHRTQVVNKAIFICESIVEVNLFVVRASEKEATQDALVEWIRKHATSKCDITKTFPGSQKRYFASEEVDTEIEEAMLDFGVAGGHPRRHPHGNLDDEEGGMRCAIELRSPNTPLSACVDRA
jgi:hypothetical protein